MSSSAVSQCSLSRKTKAQLIEELEKLHCRIRDLERREGRHGTVESGAEDRGIAEPQRAEEASQEAHDRLEVRVAERAAELQRANEALTAQIAESASRERALRASEAQLEDALDAMSEGFVYFDAEDRFIRANSKHRELFPSHAAYMVPGARFEDLLQKQIQNIRLPWAEGREDEWMAERLAQHRNPAQPVEQEFADGRIIRHSEYRTKSGGSVSIRADITELKRIEAALRESEQRASAAEQQLLDAIESISEGFVLFDAGGRLVLCNSKYKEFYRYSDSDVVPGVHTRDLGTRDLERGTVALGADDPEAYLGRRDQPMDAPFTSYTIQLTGNRRLQTRDHWTASGGIVSIQTDITDLKEIEENLHRSEEQYRDLVEGSMQGIAIHSDFKPHFVNRAWVDIFGYDSPEEVIALGSIVSLAAPHERERMAAIRDTRLQENSAPEPYEFQGLRKDGTPIWLENRGRAVAWNGEPAILSVVIDITKRKRAEQALRDSEERFRAITEASPVPLIITRRSDGIILYANPKAESRPGVWPSSG
jgi:PAS domain S-box-containing protein